MTKENLFDPYRNVVHLGTPYTGGEYTLCGLAYDEPSSEYGCDCMRPVSDPCSCDECRRIAEALLPYLKKEIKKIEQKKKGQGK